MSTTTYRDHTFDEVAPHQQKAAALTALARDFYLTKADRQLPLGQQPLVSEVRLIAAEVATYLSSTAADLPDAAYAEMAYAYVEGAWFASYMTAPTQRAVLRLVRLAGFEVNR